jgi:hypothetical protein
MKPTALKPITLTEIPPNTTVVYSAVCQAANTQIVTLTDSSGANVFTASGHGTSPKQITFGTFNSKEFSGPYTLTIESSSSPTPKPPYTPSKVLHHYDTITSGTNVYLGNYTFIAEDGTDNDYNDLYLTISWFLHAG